MAHFQTFYQAFWFHGPSPPYLTTDYARHRKEGTLLREPPISKFFSRKKAAPYIGFYEYLNEKKSLPLLVVTTSMTFLYACNGAVTCNKIPVKPIGNVPNSQSVIE